eukprot:CAMPEP_0198702018 /NCGR_PEP_ID=MMETSP1468-20131203/388524_1 /TAXON_ID=1461545 /ORGANISM="Mantoniella sp, Strain CCMP1436" /LENGTH=56 /DNA_ID=CAMNT_0044460493 /DNA_START=1240 /DNA_END=1406 /DNA_ORIENTATION=-
MTRPYGEGFANGDPRTVIYGIDYQGDLCDSGHLDGLKVHELTYTLHPTPCTLHPAP